MDSIALWIVTHCPSLGISIFAAAIGIFWTFAAIGGAMTWGDDDDDNVLFPCIVILVILGLASLAGGWASAWLPFLLGPLVVGVVIALFLTVLSVPDAARSTYAYVAPYAIRIWTFAMNKLVSRRERLRRKREEAARTPAAVIARCESIVKGYIETLPVDLHLYEEQRQVELKLAALKGLYRLLAVIEKLGGYDEAAFERHLKEADSLFVGVSLNDECGALVGKLRERAVKTPLVDRMRISIEALVLSIHSLPAKAAERIAADMSDEYHECARNLHEELGEPVLPDFDNTPAQEEAVRSRPAPKKLLA